MRRFEVASILGGAAGLLLFSLAVTPARAQDGSCRVECREAQRVCRQAAHAAYRVCRTGCHEAVGEALRRARQICVDEGLGQEECGRLIREAVSAAWGACQQDCREARQGARAVCLEEQLECRHACLPQLDPECARACGADFGACREDLAACGVACRDQTLAALRDCREQASDPEAFWACARQVRREGRLCAVDCHVDFSCGEDLRQCLPQCVVAGGAAG